ncbi:hypothetical protein, partial [Rhizobium rosettiformans]|uniref:hypothetical protein n=1 Tax=Rhizobium rosettiformans TaxID=1368430 RepID=UPI001AEDAFF9
ASPKWTGINASGGQQAKHALTFQPDHPMGAGHVDLPDPEPPTINPISPALNLKLTGPTARAS